MMYRFLTRGPQKTATTFEEIDHLHEQYWTRGESCGHIQIDCPEHEWTNTHHAGECMACRDVRLDGELSGNRHFYGWRSAAEQEWTDEVQRL